MTAANASPFHSLVPQTCLALVEPASMDPSVHQWSQPEIDALTLAHAAQRPLLIRGEPGTGKTQIARAAAQHLGWSLLAETVHPRFEASDLVYRFDAIRRLADAQAQRLGPDEDYWEPGPLWRAFGWDSACRFGSCRGLARPAGHVILVDEIDKADSDLPNSLLEVLGQRSLAIAPLRLSVGRPGEQRPLIVITTNEERDLPAAFLRRCIVLNLAPPADRSYEQWLVERGVAHFGLGNVGGNRPLAPAAISHAAAQLCADRQAAVDAGLSPPGAAEFLDLLAALDRLAGGDAALQLDLIDRLGAYAFVKHGSVEGSAAAGQARQPVKQPPLG